jgi:DNA end-binding protein Ku
VEPEELDEIAPGRSQQIELAGFVDLEEIDPVFFDTTYFVQPRKESDSKVYALLRDALEETQRAGVATMSMHQKDYLVALHTEGGVLVLHTLHWSDEVRDPQETLSNLPSDDASAAKERKMAKQLIDTMAMDFNPEEFHDRTQERVLALVEAKQKGETPEKGEPEAEPTNVVDLMSALRASVESGGGGGRKSSKGGRGQKSSKAEGGAAKKAGETGTSGTSGQEAAQGDLDELTKAELYERAADAGVSGRSKMTRDELQQALTRSSSTAGKRKAA